MQSRTYEYMGYRWCTSDFLGKGATCRVYKGVKESDGTEVAVKVYHPSQNNFDRGHEFLRKFDNDSIVKFYCEGIHDKLKCVVSIMELCSGGDLHTMLDSPKNFNGLNDKDFLLLFKGLYSSKKVLQELNVVHRDIKPLNICYHVDQIGRRHFKLIDFGFARTLVDGELAKTFAGTPEFCHPHLFERYTNRNKNKKTSGESVYLDLWSSGVTFYHAATSKLPFRPLRPQTNVPGVWLLMTLNKPRGAIACDEIPVHPPNTQIKVKHYYRLPGDIRLSQSLARLMIPILSRLLESDEHDVWNFQEYFIKCEDILSRRCVRLFAPMDGRVQKAYLHQVTNKTLQKEFKYLWRQPDPNEEEKPLPVETETEDESNASDPNISIFHNGHKLAMNESTNFHSNLPRFNEKSEIFIVVPMDRSVWNTDANVSLGPGKCSITLGSEMRYDPYPVNDATLKEAIRNLTKSLWQFAREIKSFRLAFQLYPVAVDSLCNELANRYRIVLSSVAFHKAAGSNVQEVEKTAEEYLERKVGYSKWTEMVKGIAHIPSNDLDVSRIPKTAEDILNEKETKMEMIHSNLKRVRKMVEAMRSSYDNEKKYFQELRVAFYCWIREVYFPNVDILEEFEKQHSDLQAKVQSPNSESYLNEVNMNLIRNELEQVMKKAAHFKESLISLKGSMPPE